MSDLGHDMRQIWRDNLPSIVDDLANIHKFVSDLGSLQQALFSVHKLAGSLGVFGDHEGEQLARSIEAILSRIANELRSESANIEELIEGLQACVDRFNATM